MSDLHAVLPDFSAVDKYAALLAGLETHRVSLSELLTLDAAEVGKRTRLPLLDLQRLCEEIRAQLLTALPARPVLPARAKPTVPAESDTAIDREADKQKRESAGDCLEKDNSGPTSLSCLAPANRISTLDPVLDATLAGGFPTGVLAEVVGESGVGKTQLLLSLLLAVQLPPPRGLGRKALYIASEAPLATSRLTQIIANHPDRNVLRKHCSLQSIATINTPDLEAQEHILTHQLPVQLSKAEKYGGPGGSFGLVILDSVAANFRPFFGGNMGEKATAFNEKSCTDRSTSAGGRNTSLAARSLELTRLGTLLRTLAQKHNLAVVVANQVADRFDGGVDGNHGDGGLVSLSQQWDDAEVNSRQISAISSATKRPRQGGMLPPPSALRQPPSSLLYHSQPTQESPLTTRAQRQQPPLPQAALVTMMSSQSEADMKLSSPIKHPKNIHEKPQNSLDAEIPLSAADFLPPSSQYIPPSQFPPLPPAPPVLQLDHQQRWFTGWGDNASAYYGSGGEMRNKTPSLGLVWATQLGMRVALIKASRVGGGGSTGYRPLDGSAYGGDDEEYDESSSVNRHNTGAPRLRHSWRRWMKVVFAPHVAATGAASSASRGAADRHKSVLAARMQGAVEFDITMGGLRAVLSAAEEKKMA
ncbi:DNA repair protein rhp57 [Sporothrix epigloea]|uniref:DNA repair protein rhp57 n=1 Tax=Sporothrix epigloea TaxID=1892477 RepID=A0ABP0DGS0_9PEZI